VARIFENALARRNGARKRDARFKTAGDIENMDPDNCPWHGCIKSSGSEKVGTKLASTPNSVAQLTQVYYANVAGHSRPGVQAGHMKVHLPQAEMYLAVKTVCDAKPSLWHVHRPPGGLRGFLRTYETSSNCSRRSHLLSAAPALPPKQRQRPDLTMEWMS